jgi:hypothetical protein
MGRSTEPFTIGEEQGAADFRPAAPLFLRGTSPIRATALPPQSLVRALQRMTMAWRQGSRPTRSADLPHISQLLRSSGILVRLSQR